MPPDDADPIARLAAALKLYRPAVHAALRSPGSNPAELDAFERRTGLRLPALVRRWLAWIDGERDPGARLIDNWSPMALADIERAWSVCQRVWLADPLRQHRWRGGWDRDWLPLLTNGGGDHLCLDLAGQLGPAGQLVAFLHDEPYRLVGPASFDLWLELTIMATTAAPDEPWLPETAARPCDLVRDRSLHEQRSQQALAAAAAPPRFEPRPLTALAGLDDDQRAVYPQLDNGVCDLLRIAADHARRPDPEPAPLRPELREVATAPDGHPISRLTLLGLDDRVALTLDEDDLPASLHRLGDRALVVGARNLWLLRRDPGEWILLDRLALPEHLHDPAVRWLGPASLAVLDQYATHATLPVVAVDPARLRWLGAAELPPLPTGAMAARELAQVGDRLFVAVGHGGPGGELHELVLGDVPAPVT
jgi:cell wall assembly regulator SMI1